MADIIGLMAKKYGMSREEYAAELDRTRDEGQEVSRKAFEALAEVNRVMENPILT